MEKCSKKKKKDGRIGKDSITIYVLVFYFILCKVELKLAMD